MEEKLAQDVGDEGNIVQRNPVKLVHAERDQMFNSLPFTSGVSGERGVEGAVTHQ